MKLYWKEWAIHLKLTQADIAARTVAAGHFIGPARISRIFLGHQDPQLATIKTLAAAMGLTLGQLERKPKRKPK